jgi:murein DD-endopeptidase MepM/ murein hydrolase activator NlpD
MRTVIPIAVFLFSISSSSQTNYSIRDLKEGKFKSDSSYVYALPFEKGKKVFLIQAYDSKMSHKNELALDFKVKKGTRVCAARDGVVSSLRKDSDKGGLKQENLSDGNYIIIQHSDGSSGMYWHLQEDGVLVNVGDTVKKGQVIGLSGNTGYSAFPHLHFEVQGYDAGGNYKQLPTRFETNKGISYLRPAKFYRAR